MKIIVNTITRAKAKTRTGTKARDRVSARTRAGAAIAALMAIAIGSGSAHAQTATNYDEGRVPEYSLPQTLVDGRGRKVRNERQWERRRSELLETFSNEMYGHVPARPEGLHFQVLSIEKGIRPRTNLEELEAPLRKGDSRAEGAGGAEGAKGAEGAEGADGSKWKGSGVCDRKRVRIFLDKEETQHFDVMIHLPHDAQRPVPMIVGLNFLGNENTIDGPKSYRWQYEMAARAGFGVATAWHIEIDPDKKEEDREGREKEAGVRKWYARTQGKEADWGAISAWSWALSRIMDYLETDPDVDCSRVAVIGHSRLGKTALWAGANDPRFAAVISNDSGCCGAAISRRKFGETFSVIDTAFPYWFTRKFDSYKGHEELFPADQHQLAALIAPRPLYIASARKDLWADPKGEWLTAVNASEVYERIFHLKGLKDKESMPETGQPDDSGTVAYRIRSGEHNIFAEDWNDYLTFLSRCFAK